MFNCNGLYAGNSRTKLALLTTRRMLLLSEQLRVIAEVDVAGETGTAIRMCPGSGVWCGSCFLYTTAVQLCWMTVDGSAGVLCSLPLVGATLSAVLPDRVLLLARDGHARYCQAVPVALLEPLARGRLAAWCAGESSLCVLAAQLATLAQVYDKEVPRASADLLAAVLHVLDEVDSLEQAVQPAHHADGGNDALLASLGIAHHTRVFASQRLRSLGSTLKLEDLGTVVGLSARERDRWMAWMTYRSHREANGDEAVADACRQIAQFALHLCRRSVIPKVLPLELRMCAALRCNQSSMALSELLRAHRDEVQVTRPGCTQGLASDGRVSPSSSLRPLFLQLARHCVKSQELAIVTLCYDVLGDEAALHAVCSVFKIDETLHDLLERSRKDPEKQMMAALCTASLRMEGDRDVEDESLSSPPGTAVHTSPRASAAAAAAARPTSFAQAFEAMQLRGGLLPTTAAVARAEAAKVAAAPVTTTESAPSSREIAMVPSGAPLGAPTCFEASTPAHLKHTSPAHLKHKTVY